MGSWAYFDPEYETLSIRINPPQVSVDNSTCKDCTLVKVDSVNRPGILLEVVQVLTDLDLIITKAYISSDGGWFMDVFHVTDQQGQKISDTRIIEQIEKALGPKGYISGVLKTQPGKMSGSNSPSDYTAIEVIGRDRPGLLSEISGVLATLQVNVAAAEVWTHNRRVACILYVNDNASNCGVSNNCLRLSTIEEQIKNIFRGCGNNDEVARASFSMGSVHVDRRLHQLLFSDRDYEGALSTEQLDNVIKPNVTIDRCKEKGYSVITVRCKDRPKLMFDIVCTLTDMQFVVFHATVSSEGHYASQEYYIRQMDGCTLDTEGEKEKVIKCLEAAVRRRVSEGLSLELQAKDRVGLLSEVTQVLRKNGLSVTRAGVTTVGEQAVSVFHVSHATSGKAVDAETIDELRKQIGKSMMLKVKEANACYNYNTKSGDEAASGWTKTGFFFGHLLEKFFP
ncbi:ACT domain-containing protein ACR3-like [Andrographis paniculata]|uniref:ACT domain-containing protein ACR3-like n=1 Tax=Andrographis paniculata TaxID=175694 RepID=UPI0021E72129|nr:ACT domain-containing protein ACR3-like [Andrographis paniculata]XP_051124175.1 ACT domain-containing protein ACR3-like [Andrographis paniculata]